MTEFTPGSALLGGALIGLAAAILLLANGRIAGISGILGSLFSASGSERAWRSLFLIGILGGTVVFQLLGGDVSSVQIEASTPMLIAAGLLVGFGTRLGSGCTSGHGVCGISRWSLRSLCATAVFMSTGALTVFVVRHVVGAA